LAVERFSIPSFGQQNAKGADGGYARSICADRKGGVWVGVFGRGLYRFDVAKQTWKRLSADAAEPPAERLPSNNVWYMTLDSEGTLWVATRDAGVFTIDPVRGRVSARYSYSAQNPRSLSHDNVWSVYEDAQKTMWVATFGGGLNRFHRADSSFTAVRANPRCPAALASDIVMSVFRDKENNLWVGMQLAGVAKLDYSMQKFTVLRAEALCSQVALSESVIRSLFEDSRRRLWVGTNKRGVNVLMQRPLGATSQGFQQVSVLLHDSLNSNTIAGNAVWGICEDHEGNIWLATNEGASVVDGVSLAVKKTFRSVPEDVHSLGSPTMRAIFCDSRGRVWAGAFLGGLHRYRPASNDFLRYEPDATNPNAISNPEVRTICEDVHGGKPNGNLWIGTWGGGLNYFDSETASFTVFQHNEKDSTSLASNIVRSVLVDSRGTLWVGTNNGLCRYNREKKTFTVYREPQGLPNNVVYAMREDENGWIWLSTNNGLARLHRQSGRVQAYTVNDGLPDNEFNGNVSCKGADGTLYFGSIGGVAVVRSSRLVSHPPPTTIVFTDFKIFNASVPLDTVIEQRRELRVRYADNFLTINFAALAFSGTTNVRYRYRLEGFDNNWIESGEKREAIYTNLDPGDYRLLVQARYNDDTWERTAEGQLRLVVVPPWWMTLTFRLSAALLLLASIGSLVWLRIQFLRQQAQKLQQEVALRTNELQIANVEIQRQLEIQTEQAQEIELANTRLNELNLILATQNDDLETLNTEKDELMGIVAHDLKNPLNLILNSATMLTEYEQDLAPDDKKHFLHNIVKTSERMFDLIRNLLDMNALERGGMSLNPVNFDVNVWVEQTVEQYQNAAAAKAIVLQYTGEAAMVYADEQALQQVLDNLVSNAIKYSPHSKTVFVRVKSSPEAVRVEVQDEGPGISAEDMQKLFGKFARLSAQPTGGEHSTGLGLSIVKKLVEAMQGRVWCESEVGDGLRTGATFIVELPKA